MNRDCFSQNANFHDSHNWGMSSLPAGQAGSRLLKNNFVRIKTRLLLFFLIEGILTPSYASVRDTSKNKLEYLKTQLAGNIGVVSVGYGKVFPKLSFSLDVNYGYISKRVNGSSIHSFAVRPSWHFCKKDYSGIKTNLYLGMSVIYGVTKNTHLKYPDYYPEGYYEQNAIHLQPYIGNAFSILLKNKKVKALTIFSELGSTDNQIWYALKNKVIKPGDILNLSFGVGFMFAKHY